MNKTKALGVIFLAVSVVACTDGMIDGPGQTPEERVHNDVILGTQVHKLPMTDPLSIAIINTAPTGPNMLKYYGGKVIPNAKAISVNWTGTVNSAVQTKMAGFYTGVLNSVYMDWLSEYNTAGLNGQDGQPGSNQTIGRGTFGGSVTITPSVTTKSLTDAQIQTEISNQINAGVLPQPTNNTYYAVNFPLGYSINQGGSGSCVAGGFCAYHGTFVKGGQNVYYGVLPSLEPGSGCNTGCGNAANYLDNTTSVASHEMIEAITDAEVGIGTTVARPLAWYSTSQGEIGDICNATQGTVLGGDGVTYTIQKEYDNVTGTCITSKTAAGNDFSVGLPSSTVTLAAGATTTVTVTTSVVSGTAVSVSLTVGALPSGVTGSLSPTSVTAGGSSTLTLTASATAPASSGTFTVTGTSGGTTHTASEAISVTTASGGETVLSSGVAVSGQAGAKGAQAFYKINVPSGAKTLTFTISGGTGDADLYTHFASRPSLTVYDCRPYVSGNSETCTVNNPQAGDYYAMLNGYTAYTGVTIKATYSTTTPPTTCAHAICSTGARLTASCDACASQICAVDGYCCSNRWDSICVGEVGSVCGQTCP